jgi:hypothetical protein
VGSTFDVEVTVNPKPVIANKTAIICSEGTFTVTLNGGDIVPLGTTYTWTVSANASVTGQSAQTTGLSSISQTLTNLTNTPQIVTYTVTPTSGAAGNCEGSTFEVEVTVNPKPDIANKTETICSGTAFSVTPTNGADIVPNNTTYTWSVVDNTSVTGDLPQTTGQTSISQTLTNSTNTVQTVVYTVTPTSLAGTCAGSTFTVTITVNPAPVVDAITSKTVCVGDPVSVSFTTPVTGTEAVTYSWSNDETATGLAGSGTGAISFTATNTGTTPIVSTITVTPKIGTCSGATKTFTITVNPVPVVNTVPPKAVCSGGNVGKIEFETTISGVPVTYEWTNDNAATGLGLSGVGDIPAFTATTNTGTTAKVSNITVKPIIGDCEGTAKTFTLTVYAEIRPGKIGSDQAVCHGSTPDALLEGSPPKSGGTGEYSYQWQLSYDNSTWTDISGATEKIYQPGIVNTDMYYRRQLIDDCGTGYSDTVKISVVYNNYPDIRANVCLNGAQINLGKYFDSTNLISPVEWTKMSGANISSDGEVTISGLALARTHIYTYTLKNACAPSGIKRKFYLHVLDEHKAIKPLRDTIVICYKYAEAIQLNQIFGIDAVGDITTPNVVAASYIRPIMVAPYTGAKIFNGKAAYLDSAIPAKPYHGVAGAKQIEFNYTATSGCLQGKTYRIIIVLTPDMLE